jgi:hypothetical protein
VLVLFGNEPIAAFLRQLFAKAAQNDRYTKFYETNEREF